MRACVCASVYVHTCDVCMHMNDFYQEHEYYSLTFFSDILENVNWEVQLLVGKGELCVFVCAC